jgi:hypothetical protein
VIARSESVAEQVEDLSYLLRAAAGGAGRYGAALSGHQRPDSESESGSCSESNVHESRVGAPASRVRVSANLKWRHGGLFCRTHDSI